MAFHRWRKLSFPKNTLEKERRRCETCKVLWSETGWKEKSSKRSGTAGSSNQQEGVIWYQVFYVCFLCGLIRCHVCPEEGFCPGDGCKGPGSEKSCRYDEEERPQEQPKKRRPPPMALRPRLFLCIRQFSL